MTDRRGHYWLFNIWCFLLALKALLVFGYHLTDFEVHRNWMALTHALPLRQWYLEDTSQWTLDYPPFFAYFEWALLQLVPPAARADGCLALVARGHYGAPTVLFQRASVVASELVLFGALQRYINATPALARSRAFVVALSLVLLPGLLLIDHMHFQYNGMMYGLFVLVMDAARRQRYLAVGFWFLVLLCFKHIYLYVAPAVFVFLLRAYCVEVAVSPVSVRVHWRRLAKLALVVVAVFAAAFAPFVYHGVMPQLALRLFPFSRGLTHAYWAPNVWALYSFVDRVLVHAHRHVPLARTLLGNLSLDPRLAAAPTRGLVGDVEFLVLPQVTPRVTFLLTLFYQVMALIPLFLQPTYARFVGATTLCAYASFLFGWHVHEKAILLVIFPMTLIACYDKRVLGPFNLLVACGYVSLFPLIFTPGEWVVKVVYLALWYIIYYFSFRRAVRVPRSTAGGFIVDRVTNGYILGLAPVVAVVTAIDLLEDKVELLRRLAFVKLMIVSVYCGIGVLSSWNGLSWAYFVDELIWT